MSASVSASLDYLADGRRPWLLLVFLCLALYLPGIVTLPVIDRDEARFVQASRQMLETRDFVRIRYQDEARNKKPVGIYWLQAAMVAAVSTPQSPAVWPYRMVSLFGATGAILLLFHFGAQIFDRRTALLGASLAAATLDAIFEAHIATTDATLSATAVAAQGALGVVFLSQRRGETVDWRKRSLVLGCAGGRDPDQGTRCALAVGSDDCGAGGDGSPRRLAQGDCGRSGAFRRWRCWCCPGSF